MAVGVFVFAVSLQSSCCSLSCLGVLLFADDGVTCVNISLSCVVVRDRGYPHWSSYV